MFRVIRLWGPEDDRQGASFITERATLSQAFADVDHITAGIASDARWKASELVVVDKNGRVQRRPDAD